MRKKAVVKTVEIPKGRRILAASDIHGNYQLLQLLLQKAGYSPERDELFLLGDYVEKGNGSLETIRFLMELSKNPTVHLLMGNCDTVWVDVLTDEDCHTLEYMRRMPQSMLYEMCVEAGFSTNVPFTIEELRSALRPRFRRELEFLRGLPHIIDTQALTFVHAGLNASTLPLEEQDARTVMKNDDFLGHGPTFEKYVVVGHMPVNNICEDIGNVNPYIDRERRIVGIDGGNVIRPGGQINLLMLPEIGSEEFTFLAADNLPEAIVTGAQAASQHPVYIPWGKNGIELLESGEEFSHCQQICSGKDLMIANEQLLRYMDGSLHCGEATDYLLPVQIGERVKIAAAYNDRCYCKKDGTLGWVYRKNLEGAALPSSKNGTRPYLP